MVAEGQRRKEEKGSVPEKVEVAAGSLLLAIFFLLHDFLALRGLIARFAKLSGPVVVDLRLWDDHGEERGGQASASEQVEHGFDVGVRKVGYRSAYAYDQAAPDLVADLGRRDEGRDPGVSPTDAKQQGYQCREEDRCAESLDRLADQNDPEVGGPHYHDGGYSGHDNGECRDELLALLGLVDEVASRGLEDEHGHIHDQRNDAEVHLVPTYDVDKVHGRVWFEPICLDKKLTAVRARFAIVFSFSFILFETGVSSVVTSPDIEIDFPICSGIALVPPLFSSSFPFKFVGAIVILQRV